MKSFILKLVYLCNLIIFTSSSAFGSVGTQIFDFLNLPNGAKHAGISGCSMGMIGDPFALFSNPAGLKVETPKLGCTYTNYIAGIQGGCGAYVLPAIGGTFGVGISYLNYGKILGMDASGGDLGTFSPQSLMPVLGYARAFGNSFIGASSKIICQTIEEYTSIGIAGNFGYLFYPKQLEGLVIGGTVQNLGKQIAKFNMVEEPLPFFARIGASYLLFNKLVQASAEISLPERDFIFGVEWMPSEMFTIRGGRYSWGKELEVGKDLDVFAGLSFGFGFKTNRLSLDYALTPKVDFGIVNRISLTYLFPKVSEEKPESIEKKSEPEEEIHLEKTPVEKAPEAEKKPEPEKIDFKELPKDED